MWARVAFARRGVKFEYPYIKKHKNAKRAHYLSDNPLYAVKID